MEKAHTRSQFWQRKYTSPVTDAEIWNGGMEEKESEGQCWICWTDTGNAFNIANVYYLYYKHKEEETPSLN